jgi:hypothetical protein
MKNYAVLKIKSQALGLFNPDELLGDEKINRFGLGLCNHKISVSGDKNQIITVIDYQFPVNKARHGGTGRIKKSIDILENEFGGSDMINQDIRKKTIKKIDAVLHDLANMNFTRDDRFVVLGFAEQHLDLKVANKYFQNFIIRMQHYKNNDKPFKYLAGIHFKQKTRDSIHYNVLWDLPYIPQKELLELWGHGSGSVYITRINHVVSIGDYMLGYMGKEIKDKRFESNHAYLCSRGLKRTVWVNADDKEIKEIKKDLKMYSENETYRKRTLTEYFGWRTLTEYNLEK